MKSIFLIHAGTPEGQRTLADVGAIEFAPEVFLWDRDPQSAQMFTLGKAPLEETSSLVVAIFHANKRNEVNGEHREKTKIAELFADLHNVAKNWEKYARPE